MHYRVVAIIVEVQRVEVSRSRLVCLEHDFGGRLSRGEQCVSCIMYAYHTVHSPRTPSILCTVHSALAPDHPIQKYASMHIIHIHVDSDVRCADVRCAISDILYHIYIILVLHIRWEQFPTCITIDKYRHPTHAA